MEMKMSRSRGFELKKRGSAPRSFPVPPLISLNIVPRLFQGQDEVFQLLEAAQVCQAFFFGGGRGGACGT